jgi:hypothetical protein
MLNLHSTTSLLAQFGDGFTPPVDNAYTSGAAENPLNNLVVFISNTIGFITILGGLFFIVYFVLGTFAWITSGGDSGKIEKAREKMLQGVLGIVILVISYSLIGIIGTIVGVDLINLEATIRKVLPI